MKRNIFYYLLFIGILGATVSCTRKGEGYADEISCNVVRLKSQVLNDTFILASPTKLFLLDSLLVVADTECGSNLFYVFSSDGCFLKGGGKKGEGPGEVLSPEKVHVAEGRALSYWDGYKSKLIRYDVGKLMCDSQYVSEFSINRLQVPETALLDVIPLEDCYLYNGNTGYHIGIIPDKSHVDAPLLPDVPSVELSRAVMNQGYWEVSPDGKKLVRVTYIGGIVRCCEVAGNMIQEKWIKLFFPPVYKIVQGAKPVWITWKPESQMGFEDVCVTEQSVYLLFNGRFAKDEPFANEVVEMDWDGNIRRKFQLDKTVNTIAVDERNKVIYAVTCSFDADPSLVSFRYE